jgi:Protein of unknown function (DUF2849)
MTAKAVTGNRLTDGVVVYLDAAGGWSEQLSEARIAHDDVSAAEILRLAEHPSQATRVVTPFLIGVVVTDGIPRAESQREAIRAAGPTVRLDLGKQASPE